MKFNWQDSTIDSFYFNDREYLVKRDDLLTPLSGNKARKLYGLLEKYDLANYKHLVSCGGTQSNAMLALAQLCKQLDLEFHYYTRKPPRWLQQTPIGNLKDALAYGMVWKVNDTGQVPSLENLETTLQIPQGIAMPEAELGIKKLAEEIERYCQEKGLQDIAVVQPSGTGTTALYLQQHLPYTVYTVPCIGDQDTLMKLFNQLLPNASRYPVILDSAKPYQFGQPCAELLDIYQSLSEVSGIEFELMYDAKTWLILKDWQCNVPILYVHNGGASGNSSMLARYKRLGYL